MPGEPVEMTAQFTLTDDQLAIQDMARRFTADRITPFAAEWDEKLGNGFIRTPKFAEMLARPLLKR